MADGRPRILAVDAAPRHKELVALVAATRELLDWIVVGPPARSPGAEALAMLGAKVRPGLPSQRALTALLRAESPALVHTFGVLGAAPARLAAHRLGIPVVAGYDAPVVPGFDGLLGGWRRRRAMLADGATLDIPAVRLASTATVAAELDRWHGGRWPCRVIGCGVPAEALALASSPPAVAAARQALGVGVEVPLVVAVGLAPGDLPAVWPMVAARPGALVVAVAGAPGLREAAEAQGLAQVIRLVDEVAEPALYLAAAAVVVAVGESPAAAQAAREAMALSKPVVATDRGEPAEAVRDQVTGRLVPPGGAEALGRAVGELLGDAFERARLGARGRARALAFFSLESLVLRLLRVYSQVLRRPINLPPRNTPRYWQPVAEEVEIIEIRRPRVGRFALTARVRRRRRR